MRWRNYGRIFSDEIFKSVYTNENLGAYIQNILKFIFQGPFDNKSWLVHVFNGLCNRPYCMLQVEEGLTSTPIDHDDVIIMETFSALLAICAGNSPVPGELPAQRPVTRSFDVFFDLHPNQWLSTQWWGWWFETPSCPLCRHRNVTPTQYMEENNANLDI